MKFSELKRCQKFTTPYLPHRVILKNVPLEETKDINPNLSYAVVIYSESSEVVVNQLFSFENDDEVDPVNG
jgi:hypothetical protein